MHSASFSQPIEIATQRALDDYFGVGCGLLGAQASVVFAGEVVIGEGVEFHGACRIAGGTSVGTGSILTRVTLGPRTTVRPYSILSDLTAGADNLLGPFCFIRDDCVLGDNCILAAHVEAARTRFGSGVKISHRAFVGDANVGDGTIIGAGVVFCNYDGRGRQPTTVGDHVTVGSGTLLVPPISIGDNVVIGAGSTVTKDVASGVKLIQKRQSETRT